MIHTAETDTPGLQVYDTKMKVWGHFNTEKILSQLEHHPELWNEHKGRTVQTTSPHREADDIWFRFNDIINLDPKHPEKFTQSHRSVWYPSVEKVPALKEFVENFSTMVRAKTIGGILVTRIPAGKQIYCHADSGWHAQAHRKFLVLLKGNLEQTFEFKGEIMRSELGDCFEFKNEFPHRVINPSNEDRISLIICLRDFEEYK